MAVKHTTLPRWATNDVIDPTSLLNNVLEPAEGKKDIGWNYLEKPARQYYNWLGRQTNQWLDYLDEALNLFAPHETNPATMEIELNPGRINQGTDVIFLGVQTSGAITAPITNPRIDRVVVSELTGAVSVIAGSEAASPVAPAFLISQIPIAQILLYVGMTEIVNDDITDERSKSGSDLMAAHDEIITGQWSFDNGLTQFGSSAPGDTWSAGDVLEVNSSGAIWGEPASFNIAENGYYNSGWKYKNTDTASLVQLTGGNISLFVATSGTADTAITWITALKAESNGTVKGLGGDWLISPSGVDITPSSELHIHSAGADTLYAKFTNSTSGGVLASDGFDIGIDTLGNALLLQRENFDLIYYTNSIIRGKIAAGGNWLISPDGTDITPLRELVLYDGASGDVYTQYTNNTAGFGASAGLLVGINSDENAIFLNFSNTDMNFYTDGTLRGKIAAGGKWLISPQGTDLLPLHELVIQSGDTASSIVQFVNSDSPAYSATVGFVVGINSTEQGYLWNYESKDTIFGTGNTFRGKISSGGNWLISPNGADITPNHELVVYNDGVGGESKLQFLNDDAGGTTANHGFIIGISSQGWAVLENRLSTDMIFLTGATTRMYLDNSNGGLVMDTTLGNGQGHGSINVTTGYYENGIPSVGGFVSGTTIKSNTAWTVANPATGRYVVTHNLGLVSTTDMAIVASAVALDYTAIIWIVAANTFEVRIYNTAGALSTGDFHFITSSTI